MTKKISPEAAETASGTGHVGEVSSGEGDLATRRADRIREAEDLTRLQAAFPWSAALPLADRVRFAHELADHSSRLSDRDLERLLGLWRARAHTYTSQGARRGRSAA
ncbi:hypothetical protein OSC27_07250 [Microbacterium sp. STN6]|uniref:hypothetical protein n=1 Tax=Microbacterium sp. STN6 TaxID=2995588 RepID=UPI0022609D98|nr:hypothetical protein [Microbacterium sp. STN6]MCX7522073.1 hypothetical protein [Microbacterium sp. STN6]